MESKEHLKGEIIRTLKESLEASFAKAVNISHRQNNKYRHGEMRNSLHDFEILAYLGSGSFGQVQLIRTTSEEDSLPRNSLIALKTVTKASLKSKTKERIHAEKEILKASNGSPWVVQLYKTFQVC